MGEEFQFTYITHEALKFYQANALILLILSHNKQYFC